LLSISLLLFLPTGLVTRGNIMFEFGAFPRIRLCAGGRFMGGLPAQRSVVCVQLRFYADIRWFTRISRK